MMFPSRLRRCVVVLISILALPFALQAADPAGKPAEPPKAVSYYRQIRPIFQAQCQGCHQPARAKGDYIMTDFAKLRAGGESEKKAIVAKHPEQSHLIEQIVPKDGKAKMPEGRKPLAEFEIDLVRRWIVEGAVDDTPANARQTVDPDHPPVYTRPPVITSLDYAPNGKVLAVAGFHEVLLVDAETGERTARLIGLSDRIQSLRFSPDGKYLAVTGGLPGRMGEVQVWDVVKARLVLSVPVSFDTVYGVSWSPDGTKIAFGCVDNTVRAIDFTTGEQVLYQGSHGDLVLDTVFSADSSHLVSVSRDMTVKLTEVATQRFVDNITSITPGALKGGIQALARHPQRDEIVIGGADGVVKVYRIHRLTKRVIGDDANMIRQMPAMTGRIFSVAVSKDGKRIAAASSLDGAGQVAIYGYEFDTGLPNNIKAINEKVVTTRSGQEKAELAKYHTTGVQRIAQTDVKASVYAVAFHPDGKVIAAAGSDGTVRLIDTANGTVVKELSPAPVDAKANGGQTARLPTSPMPAAEVPHEKPESLPPGTTVAALEVQPAQVKLHGKFDYNQLVVMAKLASGESIDATRMAEFRLSADVADVARSGLVHPKRDGKADLEVRVAGQALVRVPVEVDGLQTDRPVDFIRDVMPALSRMGCNAGTCHGAAKGRNGFKLSLRGYDPIEDVRALTDDLASRRVNIASPDDSLMLLKLTGAVPHVGGQRTRPGEPYYAIVRSWIAAGAKLDLKSARVAKIEIGPLNPVVQHKDSLQQLRVVATYHDGTVRDVTGEAFIDSGNNEVATAAPAGLMTGVRRGEAAMLARFEGAYAATILTVMGDRKEFIWEEPPTFNRVDELTAAKWKRLKIRPSEVAGDTDFLRRVHLDLTGLPPTPEETRAFVADPRPLRVKRDEVIDKLVGSDPYIEYWTNKWADLLQVNRKYLGPQGAASLRRWIRGEVANNTPYDQFVRKVLTASGSNADHPAASYYKILREPDAIMENTTHLFLGVRFNCNKCHDHPFERWTQDNYYQTAAYFARIDLKPDPKAGGQQIGATAVEKGKPLYEIVGDKAKGEVEHLRTGTVAPPQFPYEAKHETPAGASRRDELAAWITSPDNAYFAKSYVNRLWGYLFGVGIIDPIDDIRAGNPPTNPELLDYLTKEFISSGFDARHIVKLICKSRTYQLAVATNQWNADDRINYAHAIARRLPAEVLLDSVYRVTGAQSHFPGVAPGTRAAALPDSGVELPTGFLATFGRPSRESACECERVNTLQLGPVMALVNGKTLADAIGDPNNAIAKLVASEKDDTKLINEFFMRILNRTATEKEIKESIETIKNIGTDHQKLIEAVAAREKEIAPLRAKLEAERVQAIAKAKTELEAYQKQIAPKQQEQERQRTEKIGQTGAALKKYEPAFADKLAAWEKKQQNEVEWVILDPKTLKGAGTSKLTREKDLSVSVAQPARGAYTVTAETKLEGITAVRLEVLADPRLPNHGPGLGPDGNFVLTEFQMQAAPKDKPAKPMGVALQNALADTFQPNAQGRFDPKTAIDGDTSTAGGRGWAIGSAGGATHWLTAETKQPVGFAGGTLLTFTLHQQFIDAKQIIGRFRISVAVAKPPVGLDLSDELKAIVGVGPRSPAQQAELVRYFHTLDDEYRKLAKALKDAQKPLPPDPRLKELQDGLALVNRPLPPDGKLTQLRADLDLSAKQLVNPRLTAAQDIAWALINSPAFLFNR